MNEKAKTLATAGILTRLHLATELGVSEETIATWETEHDFPGRKAGRTTLYDVDAIKKWIGKGG